jgi:hypothetical protein
MIFIENNISFLGKQSYILTFNQNKMKYLNFNLKKLKLTQIEVYNNYKKNKSLTLLNDSFC